MWSTSELENFQGSPPLLAFQHVAQDDNVVGNELLDAIAGNLAVLCRALRGQKRRQAQPFECDGDTEHLAPHGGAVGELREDSAKGIHGKALRAHARYRVLYPCQQRAEIVVADDHRLMRGLGRGVHERPTPLGLPGGDVPAKTAHVEADVGGALLEGDEHPGLASVADALGEELRGEDRFGTPGSAAYKRGAS